MTKIYEARMVKGVKGWVVDSTSTKHVGAVKEEISYYTPIDESIECEYVGTIGLC